MSTNVETLEYWQKPQVSASYSRRDDRLDLHFGIPSAEAYDYATSSGAVDIPISGAIRVNAKFFSEDIPHNLGIGDVSINVSVEYDDDGGAGSFSVTARYSRQRAKREFRKYRRLRSSARIRVLSE